MKNALEARHAPFRKAKGEGSLHRQRVSAGTVPFDTKSRMGLSKSSLLTVKSVFALIVVNRKITVRTAARMLFVQAAIIRH
jgi:hypothetical protein